MYSWAYVNLWLFCSKKVVANLFPNEDQSLRDYLIACQVFTFWLDPTIEEERQLLSEIFSSYLTEVWILDAFSVGNESTAKFIIENLKLKGAFEGYHNSYQSPVKFNDNPYIRSMVGIENWNQLSEDNTNNHHNSYSPCNKEKN